MKLGKINRYSIANNTFLSPLLEIQKPPAELHIIGTLPKNRPPVIAIVGSRRPTAYGTEITQHFATSLARAGVVVVSGLAYGIDAIAHKAALEAGGITIAVMAGGLHSIYPAGHTGLAGEIVEKGGALLSEHEVGVEAFKYHFLARNRIVSGLADAILVTEAGDKSGTFSTVGHAIDQNKVVFAAPGPINSLLSAGPNRLIQQGAHVALDPQDILDIIAPKHKVQQQLPLGNTPLEVTIISLIQKGIHDGETLLQQSKAPAHEFSEAMTMLELNGVVKALGNNKWGIS